MIRHVLIDLDDTILDFHRSEAEALSEALRGMNIEPTDEVIKRYSEINDAQWKLLEKGEVTREEVLTNRFAILFSELSLNLDPMKMRKSYESLLSESYHFMPGAIELLENLHTGYNLYLASNGTDSVQTKRIAAAGIEKYFKDIFISERLGHNKPSIEYFEKCFERMGNPPLTECIIVGDSLSSDIQGGINARIYTCRYNPKGLPQSDTVCPNFEISSLDELYEILENN